MCLFLLDHGADIFARDHNGETAVTAASQNSAADSGDTVLLQALVERIGEADINDFFDDMSASMVFNYGSPTVVELLRSRGMSFEWEEVEPTPP